ncbi:HU family DNA-binding protein [Bacteroides gallinarum]|uniref:HU family DNA-binding protein n=1 Tax=Bacteroides gallinarum TaxID=376806 RepID=UPI00037D77D5|nr:HU family DNA-binding protein [Bacteroides gallinarum]
MNEKLNIQNLIELLAEKHGMSKRNADSFVKEFFQLIEEALEKDKYVKIKGLGAFKLIDVESRESVNVNTGERFEIQGHTKVSFTPEPALKDIINKPFSHFETVVLNDNTVLEDTPIDSGNEDEEDTEQRVEAVAGTSEEVIAFEETGMLGETETPEPAVTLTETVLPEKAVSSEEAVASEEAAASDKTGYPEQTEVLTETEPLVETEPLKAPEISKETEHLKEPEAPREPETPREIELPAETAATKEKEAPKEKEAENPKEAEPLEKEITPSGEAKPEKADVPPPADSSTMKYFISIVVFVVLLCAGAVTYLYCPDLFDNLSSEPPVKKEVAAAMPDKPVNNTVAADTTAAKDTTAIAKADTVSKKTVAEPVAKKPDAPAVAKQPAPVPAHTAPASRPRKQVEAAYVPDSTSYTITGTETKYTIKPGETLTRVSLRFYGTKALYPYIVKHNRDIIKKPNNVPAGTTIKIPKLVKKQ